MAREIDAVAYLRREIAKLDEAALRARKDREFGAYGMLSAWRARAFEMIEDIIDPPEVISDD